MDRNMFPSWMRDSIKIHSEPNTILPCIERFFTERGFLERSRVNNNFDITTKTSTIMAKKQVSEGNNLRKRTGHFILNTDILQVYDHFEDENNEENCSTSTQITSKNVLKYNNFNYNITSFFVCNRKTPNRKNGTFLFGVLHSRIYRAPSFHD